MRRDAGRLFANRFASIILKIKSKAPVSQLVNVDDTSVIEIKTATDTSLKAKRNYIFARLCNEK